jgi:hypothetical protein
MGKQGVALENRIGLPLVWGKGKHIGTVKGYRTGIGTFKARKNPQQGGFSAPGGAQERKKLTLFN